MTSSNTTGGWQTLFTWTAYISGGIGTLMIGMSVYSMYAAAKEKLSNIAGSIGSLAGAQAAQTTETAEATESPTVQAGGGRSLHAIAQEMLNQRKAGELPSESLLFMGILFAVALGGITYAVFQYQKQSKAKEDEAARIRDSESSEALGDTDGV